MKPSEIKEIVEILDNSQIQQIEIKKWWGYKLKMSKVAGSVVAPAAVQPVAQPVTPVSQTPAVEPAAPQADAPPAAAESGTEVIAPMVGTFYMSPSPEAAPFVKEGDVIAKGQVLCIIEAMKLMNEIEAEISGKVVKILVENAQPVEYGQPLFLVDPS